MDSRGRKQQETGEYFVMDITFCTFYYIRMSVESFNHIQCDTQDFNMLGNMNYYKILQSAGKPLVGRTGIDRRILHFTTPRNIQSMDSGSIDKHVINCDRIHTDMLDDQEASGSIASETEIVICDGH